MSKYCQELKYLENWDEIAKDFLKAVELYKYPSELSIDKYSGVHLRKGDIVRLIDKNYGIDGIYEVTKIDKKGKATMKFKKINKEIMK